MTDMHMTLTLFEALTIFGVTASFVFVVVVPFIVGIVSRASAHAAELKALRELQISDRLKDLEGSMKSHIEADVRVHDGLREDMAQYAMDSTKQHGELKDALDALRAEATEGRRTLHADFNELREKVGEVRGEITGLSRIFDRVELPRGGAS